MTIDVGSTKRKPLTPTQRLALFERHKGICALCGTKIEAGEAWIDEHLTSLGLGGSNDDSNRAPAHVRCAEAKTNGADGDLAKIAKAKRRKMKHLGIAPAVSRPIQSAPFRPGQPARRASSKLTKDIPPRRSPFTREQIR